MEAYTLVIFREALLESVMMSYHDITEFKKIYRYNTIFKKNKIERIYYLAIYSSGFSLLRRPTLQRRQEQVATSRV